MISFFNEDIGFEIRKKKLLKIWIKESILAEKKLPGQISVILCSDEYLHKLNQDYLQHDTYTDIITFDYSESNTISGDLFISIERVKENATAFSKKLADELHRVIIHGILHLCGYDDKSEKGKKEITLKEDEHLSRRLDQLKV
jgi:probable rRNA maturation factor